MKPCLIFFDIFRSSFGSGLIHERLSVRLSLHTNNMPKIWSNMCFMLKPDSAPPQAVRHQPLHRQQRPRYHPKNHKSPVNLFFPHDDLMRKPMKFHSVLDSKARALGHQDGPRPQRE